MMCSKCKKKPAVVFIAPMNGDKKNNQGLCLSCAKELGLPQIDAYLKKIGFTEEEFEQAFTELFGPTGLLTEDDCIYHGEMDGFPNCENGIKDAGFSYKEYMGEEDDEDEDDDGGNDVDVTFSNNLFQGDPPPERMPQILKNILYNNNGKIIKNGQVINSISDESDDEDNEEAGTVKTRTKKKKEKKLKFLDTYATNLTKRASEGKMDQVIGRDKEINRVIQILSRRTKNNPCLIGEPGVGKTAIAEGIAQRLVAEQVPCRLLGKQLYMLDLTALVAGTQFRGQFEGRVKSLIEEVKRAGNILLFIDEVHNLVSSGENEGTMNMANIFKPALSRGELQVIGATTFNEYRKHIEKDSALERRFQPVTVAEPTIDETIELLKGIKGYYEKHHGIRVPDPILKTCAILSERYITDRFLPDKAIDLLDEAAANASIKNKTIAEYEILQRKNQELSDEVTALTTSQPDIDYERMAEIRVEFEQNKEKINQLMPMIDSAEVTEEDVCTVIELWTGIPANKIMETEFMKISRLEDVLKSKIIGQDEACRLVANAIKRSRVQLATRRRPASFIFVGPTGVGKTELVKVLSKELFDSVDPLIRLDMSEYLEKYSVSKIIGAPPGYVGYDEAGQLTERVRRKPYSVILFDEIEKAHPDVMNILLQILDEGRITDSHGRVVNFEHTVIAMTSNAGSSDGTTSFGFGKTENDISRDKVTKALSAFLRPEFLGRIDEIVVFNPLSKENYAEIAKLMLEEMREPLGEKNIELVIDDSALEHIANLAFGGKFGGRDIRKTIRREVEDKVADLIISHGENRVEKITIGAADGEIVVS